MSDEGPYNGFRAHDTERLTPAEVERRGLAPHLEWYRCKNCGFVATEPHPTQIRGCDG